MLVDKDDHEFDKLFAPYLAKIHQVQAGTAAGCLIALMIGFLTASKPLSLLSFVAGVVSAFTLIVGSVLEAIRTYRYTCPECSKRLKIEFDHDTPYGKERPYHANCSDCRIKWWVKYDSGDPRDQC